MICSARTRLIDHASQVGFDTDNVYVGISLYIDHTGKILSSHRGRVHSLEDLVRIGRVWRSGGQIVQPEVLFPRQLALAVGGVNPDNHRTMDYELWGKFFLAGARFCYTDIPFGMFREQPNQKTQDVLEQTSSLLDTAAKLVHQASFLSHEVKNEILAELQDYAKAYEAQYWKGTGRLARIGLPRELVTSLRSLKTVLQKALKSRSINRSSSYTVN